MDEIFHRGGWHAGQKNAVNHAGVATVELAEGRAVAMLCGFDESVVGAGGVCRGVRAAGEKRRLHLGFKGHGDNTALQFCISVYRRRTAACC